MSNLLEKASILLTPTAYDDGKILSVKPIDGSGDLDFTRNSDATRVNSAGLIESLQTLSSNLVSNGDFSQEGPELVTNGDFATDSDWTADYDASQSDITISNGELSFISSAPYGFAKQQINVTSGKIYKITADIKSFSGSMRLFSESGNNAKLVNSTGIITSYFTPIGATTKIGFSANNDIGASVVCNSISCVEVGQDWVLGTDWGIGNNKAIRTGTTSSGLTQSGTFSLGKKFKLNFTITDWTTGNLQGYFYGGGGNDAFFSKVSIGNGTFTFETTTTTNRTNIAFFAFGGFDGSVSNVSVIEITDDTNLPRIDYSPYSGTGTCGHWLFEPQSTNLFPYSNDFSQWDSLGFASVINNALVSPDGTLNADEFVFDGSSNGRIEERVSTTNGLVYTFSIYLKNKDIANPTQVWIGNESATEGEFVTITNEWQRFTTTQTANNTNEFPRVRYNGIGSLYAYGAQFEQLSYATSYIPTTGSAVTRNQELCNNSGTVNDFNSEEGVLYAEIAALANDGTNRIISLSDGSTSNVVRFYYSPADNQIVGNIRSGGTTFFNFNNVLSSATDFLKVAISYKLNEFKMYVNGTLVSTDTSGNTPVGLSQLSFNNGASSFKFYGKTKNLKVFKRALTDAELQELTT